MKIKICDNPSDLEKASSILFVGKCAESFDGEEDSGLTVEHLA